MCRKKRNTRSTYFWIPLLLFSIVQATASESEIAGYRRAPADDSINNLQRFARMIYETVSHENPSQSEIARDRRAPADDIIDNLQRLSRITSGIALEIGLLDGTLDPDTAVRDLLHLGTLAPFQLISMDSGLVKSAMDEFKTLIAGIDSSPTVTVVEDRLLILEKIRTTFDVAQFKNLNGKADYRKLLDEVVKLESETKNLRTISSTVQAVYSPLKQFLELGENIGDVKTETGRMAFLAGSIKNIESESKSFDSIKKLLKATKTLKDQSSFLQLLVNEFELRSSVQTTVFYDGVPNLLENFKKVYSYQKSKSNSKDLLEVLLKLIRSRDDSSVQAFSFASGVPHGAKDLELLATDSIDEWIQKNVGAVTDNLKIAFDSLNGVTDHLKSIEDDWKSIHTKSNPTISIFELQTTVLGLSDRSDSVSKSISSFKQAEATRDGTDKAISEIKGVRGLIEELNTMTENINTFEYVDKLKDLSFLKTALSGSPEPNETELNFVKRIVKTLNGNPDTSKIISNMEQFHKDLDDLETLIPKITSLAKEIVKEIPKIDTYHQFVSTDAKMKFYKDITSVGDSGLGEIVGIVQRIRKTNVAPVSSVITSALKPQKSLSDAVQNAENLKSLTIPELVSMKGSLQDCLKVAEKLGMGVQGLFAIQKASNAKSTVAPLLDVAAILQSSSGLAKEHQDSLQKLNGLATTFKEIKEFHTTMAGYQGFRKKRDADFKSLGTVFDEAAKVTEFKQDLKPIQEAMDTLNQATNNKFADAKAALDMLTILDLEFTKYKIGEAKDSLTAMDTFFVEYTKKLKALPPANPPPKSPSAPKGPATASNSIKTSTESAGGAFFDKVLEFCKTPGGIAVLVFVAVVIGVGIFFAIRHFCCKEKKKKNDDDDDDSLDSVVTASTAVTPASTAPTTTTEDPKKPKDPKPKEDKDGPGAGPSGSNDGRTTPTPAPTILKEVPKETSKGNSKEAPKEKPSNSGSKESNMDMAYDKTQDRTRTESVSKTEDASSAHRNLKAPPGTPPKNGYEVEVKYTAKNRPLTPHPSHPSNQEALGRKPKKKVSEKEVSKEVLATADEIEEQPKQIDVEGLEKTQNSIREDAAFSLLIATLKGIEDFRGRNQAPHDYLGLMCSIKGDLAVFTGHEKKNRDGRRSLVYPCRDSFRFSLVGFTDPFFNCNYKQFGKIKWWCGEAASDGTEWVRDPTGRERRLGNTLGKTVAFLVQAGIRVVLKLCDWEERGNKTCARYYSEKVGETLRFGRYEVTTVGTGTLEDYRKFTNREQFAIYELVIKNILPAEGQPESVRVTVVYFSGWKKDITPKEPQSSVDMIKFADEFEAPVYVHCIDGVTRTGALVAVKCGILYAKRGQQSDISKLVISIRQSRFGVITRPDQVSYIVLCVTKAMMDQFNYKYMNEYWAMWFYHQQMCRGAYNHCRGFESFDKCAQNDMDMFLRKDEHEKSELIQQKRDEYLLEVKNRNAMEKAAQNVKQPEQKSKKSKKSKGAKGSKDKV